MSIKGLYVGNSKVQLDYMNLDNIPDSASNAGRLTNLYPCAMKSTNGAFEVESYGTGTVYSYGSIVRLKDANAVHCNSDYQLTAMIYSANYTTNAFELVDAVQNGANSTYEIDGFSRINLDEYDATDGYAIVFVTRKDGKPFGIMRGYFDALDNVYVEYKPNVVVSRCQGNLGAIVAANIRDLFNWTIPETFAFNHTPLHGNDLYIPAMEDVSPALYGGYYVANSLLLHITPKSILTAAKNPNSRFYVQTYGVYDRGTCGYGLMCSELVSVLNGWDEVYGTYGYRYKETDKFTAHELNDLCDLRSGDILILANELFENRNDGHINMVYDAVYINGELVTINVLEGYPPFARIRPFFNSDLYSEISYQLTGTNSYCNIENLRSRYKYFARPNWKKAERLAHKYDFETRNYSVGTIMCDRGTDALYTVASHDILLSVSDDEAESVLIYKDGTLYATVSLSGATEENGLRVIDIAPQVVDYGYYTLRTDTAPTVVQESFYVPNTSAIPTSAASGSNTVITIPNPSDVQCVYVYYAHEYGGELEMTYTPDEIENGALTVPTNLNKGHAQAYTKATVLYKTNYGTWWGRTDGLFGVHIGNRG